MNAKKMLSILLVICVILGTVGCGSSTPASSEASAAPGSTAAPASSAAPAQDDNNEVLRIAVGREIKALDGEYGSNVGFNPYLHVFDPLINVNSENQVVECLATAWEQIDDTSWKFTLREGVKFHDGSDFTAADVKYTFDRIATEEPKFNYAGNWGTAWPPETEIVDDYTVIIKYQSPQPLFLLLLPRIGVLPEGAVEANPDFFISGLIGTGAYTFDSWDVGNTGRITIKSNPNYWGGQPDIETLIYEAIPDASARALAYQNREYDYVYELPYDQIESLSTIPGTRVEMKETVNLNYVVLNPIPQEDGSNNYLLDPNFRKAVIYAVDHEPLAQALSAGYSHSIDGLGMPFTKGYRATGGFPERDVEKAKELLAASSYNGETVRMYVSTGQFYNDVVLLEAMKTQLEEVGITCSLEECDSGTWKTIRNAHEYEIGVNNGGTTIGDASFYYTQNRTTFGYKTDECEAILTAMADPSLSDEEYTKMIGDLLETFMKSDPFVWVATCPYVYGMVDNIENVGFLPWGFPRFHEAVMN
jgi:peptide/nickel transport system substrate-binding protein